MHYPPIDDSSVGAWRESMAVTSTELDDEEIAEPCYYCGKELDPRYDYSCPSCTRETCDNCSQACQEDECDGITCFRCVEWHLAAHHTDLL